MNEITKYVNNKNFHTTLINFIYEFKIKKEEIMALSIITKLFNKTNNIYKDEISFQKEKLNRYIINYNCLNQGINDVYFLNFSLLIPSQNVINEDMLENQIMFLLDSIYNNNLSDETLFEKEKKLYIETLLNGYKNIEFIAEKNLLDILDDDAVFNKLKYRDLDNINCLNLDDILNFYNKYIKNVKPKIFVNGNIDTNKLNDIIHNYFNKLNLVPYKIIKDYNIFYNDNNYIEKIDKSKFYQSILYYVYNVKDYKEEDFYKLYMINLLLNSSSSGLLMNSLRKKSNLVYSTGSNVMLKNGLLFIKAVSNKTNIDYVKIIIKELMNELNNIEKYDKNIYNILKRLELNKERELDNFYIATSDIINKYFETDLTTSEELEILNRLSYDELKEFVSRMNLKATYVLEGEL